MLSGNGAEVTERWRGGALVDELNTGAMVCRRGQGRCAGSRNAVGNDRISGTVRGDGRDAEVRRCGAIRGWTARCRGWGFGRLWLVQ
jgi:hypothetical protein